MASCQVRSCKMWVRAPEQRVAGSTLRRYSLGLRLARHARILQIGRNLTQMKPVDASSAWSRPSDLDKKESDGRDPPEGVVPHAHRGVVGAYELCR